MRTACSVCRRAREATSGILLSVGLGTCSQLASALVFQFFDLFAQFVEAGGEGAEDVVLLVDRGGEGGEFMAQIEGGSSEGGKVAVVILLQFADAIVEDFDIVA
jgi:hypothetical protein